MSRVARLPSRRCASPRQSELPPPPSRTLYPEPYPTRQSELPAFFFFFFTLVTGILLLYSRQVFFFTLVTGPRRSLGLKLSDTRVYEPQIRARLGTTAHFCEVVVSCPPPSRTLNPEPYPTY